ncbi:hypothetical protein [Mesorhizobium sp. M0977]|uniref:hypothetical protein n=2 Tax=unclassified Mesorhizobium TaxID=325217 RepID=UPI0033386481
MKAALGELPSQQPRSWDFDGLHLKTGDRSADDCFRSKPSAVMTRPVPRHIFTNLGTTPFCAGIRFGSIVAPTALRNDQLFQHNQKKTQEGNER